jgi:hypothetical protein
VEIMAKNSLFSAQGSFLVGVDVDKKNEVDVIDLVRAKKAAAGLIDAPRYDMNGDGVVDETDILSIRKKILDSV